MVVRPQKAYLTRQGRAKYENELQQMRERLDTLIERLKSLRHRNQVVDSGDWELTQNEIENVITRIKEVEQILMISKLIRKIKSQSARIGSFITCKLAGKLLRFRLVDSVEADPDEGKISIKSPIGRALLGKQAGDSATVAAPGGILTYKLLAIN